MHEKGTHKMRENVEESMHAETHLELRSFELTYPRKSADDLPADLRQRIESQLHGDAMYSLLSYLRVFPWGVSIAVDLTLQCSSSLSSHALSSSNTIHSHHWPSAAALHASSVACSTAGASGTTSASASTSATGDIVMHVRPEHYACVSTSTSLFALVKCEGWLLYAPVSVMPRLPGVLRVKLFPISQYLPTMGSIVVQLARAEAGVQFERWVGEPVPVVLSNNWRVRSEIRSTQISALPPSDRVKYLALLHLLGRALGGKADTKSLHRASALARNWGWHQAASFIAQNQPNFTREPTSRYSADDADSPESSSGKQWNEEDGKYASAHTTPEHSSVLHKQRHMQNRLYPIKGQMRQYRLGRRVLTMLFMEIITGPILYNFTIAKGFSYSVAWMRALTFVPLVMVPGELSPRMAASAHSLIWCAV